MGRCSSCAACCAVYCFVCSLLLGVFCGMVHGSVSFNMIGVKHQWDDMHLKLRACYLAAAYYFVMSVICAIIGFARPWLQGRKKAAEFDTISSHTRRDGASTPQLIRSSRSLLPSRASPPPPAPGGAARHYMVQRHSTTTAAAAGTADKDRIDSPTALSSHSINFSPNSSSTHQLVNHTKT